MKDELVRQITNKQSQVGVIGLGYVGLPLLVEFASKGFRAIGFEVDENKAKANIRMRAGRQARMNMRQGPGYASAQRWRD